MKCRVYGVDPPLLSGPGCGPAWGGPRPIQHAGNPYSELGEIGQDGQQEPDLEKCFNHWAPPGSAGMAGIAGAEGIEGIEGIEGAPAFETTSRAC